MIAVLEFVFASGWRFLGTLILLIFSGFVLNNVALIRVTINKDNDA